VPMYDTTFRDRVANRRRLTAVLVALAAVGAACGGDDDASPPTGTAGAADAESTDPGAADELALGDPCELVPAAAVAEVVGADVTAELVNVGDGLPGATCAYTVESGGMLSLSLNPDGVGFYDAYREQALAGGGVDDVPGLGDDGYVF